MAFFRKRRITMRCINPEREVRSYPDSEMRNPIGRGDSPEISWSSALFVVGRQMLLRVAVEVNQDVVVGTEVEVGQCLDLQPQTVTDE